MSVKEKMTAIADSIRDKTGKTNPLNLDDMASGVDEVYEKGKENGIIEVVDEWYESTFPRTWEGACYFIEYLFYKKNFDDFPFKKPFPLNKSLAKFTMCSCFGSYLGSKPIPPEIMNLDGVSFPNNYYGGLYHAFYYAQNLEEIPCYNWNAPYKYWGTFSSAIKVKKIGTLKSAEYTTYNDCFSGCSSLTDITFEGVIGQNISFSSSPLTPESMKNIVKHLKNYAGTDKEYAYTITVKEKTDIELCDLGFTLEDIEWLDENGIEHPEFEEYEDDHYGHLDFFWSAVIDEFKWNLVTVA